LKNCTARSCFLAAASEENVPRFLLFPVFESSLREYNRNSPDLSFRIINTKDAAR